MIYKCRCRPVNNDIIIDYTHNEMLAISVKSMLDLWLSEGETFDAGDIGRIAMWAEIALYDLENGRMHLPYWWDDDIQIMWIEKEVTA